MTLRPFPPRRLASVARVVIAVVLVTIAGACSSTADAKSSPPTVGTTPTTRAPNPYYDGGNTVTITASGFQPRELVASVNVPLVFVNHTKTVQRVQFEHSRDVDGQLLRSGPIPPGGSWSYTWRTWESATYHSIDRPAQRGQIQIQPPAEP
jgi:hypothetical protein